MKKTLLLAVIDTSFVTDNRPHPFKVYSAVFTSRLSIHRQSFQCVIPGTVFDVAVDLREGSLAGVSGRC